MAKTVQVNIIYAAQDKEATSPRFKNEKGELWMNPHRKPDMHNISMSFYSANYPNPQKEGDSIYIIEPRCIDGGERDYEIEFLNKFKYVFTWATEAFKGTEIENKIIPLHHPSCFGANTGLYENRKKEWLPWDKRSNEIVIIANNKRSDHESSIYNFRIELADWFYNHHKSHKISWYGNSTINRPYYRGKVNDKFDILKKVKFSICTENSYHEKYSYNYFTEKMPEVWLGGAVPLYVGCYNIDSFGFNPKSYIDLRDFQSKKLEINDLSYMMSKFNSDNYNQYKSALEYNVYQANLFDKISHEKEMEIMLNTFYNLENGI